MREDPSLSGLKARLHDALARLDPTLADIYLGLLYSLQHTELPDRHAIIGNEARELMNQAALRLAVPGDKPPAKPEGLRELVQDLATHYRELEHQMEAAVPEADEGVDPVSAFLNYVRDWLDRVKMAHPAKRRLVQYLARNLDPSRSTPHAKRSKLIFKKWSRLERFFNGLLHHGETTSEGELQKEVADLEDFLTQRIWPTPFADQKVLEFYSMQDPSSLTPEGVDRLLGLLGALDVNYRFFFANLHAPSWISFLEKNGFFTEAVPLEEYEGRILASDWPEVRYLERVASQVPEDATRVALRISRDRPENPRVHDALLGIAQTLFAVDPARAKKLLNEELKWIKEQTYLHYLLPEKLLQVSIAAARSKCSGAAVSVTRALLALEISETAKKQLSKDKWIRMDRWDFHKILRKLVEDLLPWLYEPSQLEFLAVLFGLFDLLVEYEFGGGNKDVVDYDFQMWRPAIEDHSQNDPNALSSWGIEAIRDAAEYLLADHRQVVLTALEKRGSDTLRRIALLLRQLHPDLDPEGAIALMTNPDTLRNIRLRHELFQLLKHRFGTIDKSAQNSYFKFVGKLADPHKKQLYLWPIQEYLPPHWAEVYAQLEEQLGPPDHPDLPAYHETVWIGPTSPYSTDEMLKMSPEQLVEALNAWRFTGEWRAPEPEGLARELAKLAAKDAPRLSEKAEAFETLTQPTYVRGIAQGLDDAVKAQQAISWKPVLHFCKWAVDQPRGEGPEHTGKQIAWLLYHGTKKSPTEIPLELRENVWSILAELVTDVDPTEEDEKASAEYSDPSTIAINTVRGVALGAVLSYALWVVRHSEVENRSWESFGLGEVREVLEDRLASNSSVAVRSVFGKWFSALFRLDEVWTNANVNRIFPQTKGSERIWHAAWDAYLMFSSPIYLESFHLLRTSYEKALAELGLERPEKTRTGNPDERLGGHLVLLYRNGVLEKTDPLLLGYFERAEAKLRYSVMVDAVRQVQEIREERRGAVIERLRELWKWRCRAAIDENDVEYHELSAFSWWFLKDNFSPEWRLEQLLTTQQKGIKLELDGRVLERLVELTPSLPSQVLGCLNAIVRNPANRNWGIYDDHVKEILRVVLDTAKGDLRSKAGDLANYIGSLGFYRFRDLTSK